MVAKVQRWGNSQGLRLARRVLQDARIAVGEDVDVIVKDGTIIITPIRRVRGKRDLRELVSRIRKNTRHKELSWGRPVGLEDW